MGVGASDGVAASGIQASVAKGVTLVVCFKKTYFCWSRWAHQSITLDRGVASWYFIGSGKPFVLGRDKIDLRSFAGLPTKKQKTLKPGVEVF